MYATGNLLAGHVTRMLIMYGVYNRKKHRHNLKATRRIAQLRIRHQTSTHPASPTNALYPMKDKPSSSKKSTAHLARNMNPVRVGRSLTS